MKDLQNRGIAEAFGEVLREVRINSEISQEELAFRAGVDRTFIYRLEHGVRQPTITTILDLARALDVSARDLVGEVEDRVSR
jgi:transcriptional regulator with XRE-family HTH domain